MSTLFLFLRERELWYYMEPVLLSIFNHDTMNVLKEEKIIKKYFGILLFYSKCTLKIKNKKNFSCIKTQSITNSDIFLSLLAHIICSFSIKKYVNSKSDLHVSE